MHRRTRSFSSTLLDAIYRSIDDSSNGNEPALCHYRENTSVNPVKKQSCGSMEKVSSLRRAIMIEKLVEKQRNHGPAVGFNSVSSSSDSSAGGIFSSSETESSYKEKPRRSEPKNVNEKNKEKGKAKSGGGFIKTKLKALEIYGELKKVKQPISPGGRITAFLNSIFNANAKKAKMSSNGVPVDANLHRKSTTFSRSCLSKPPSSSNGNKRSVKFCPVSVIVDEDGHKCSYEQDPRLMSTSTVRNNLKFSKKQESAVGSKASDHLRIYQRKLDLRGFIEDYDDDDDNDALSCSSSDLFELDHLIGIGRYREELPVYETTRLKNNQAFVNGFML